MQLLSTADVSANWNSAITNKQKTSEQQQIKPECVSTAPVVAFVYRASHAGDNQYFCLVSNEFASKTKTKINFRFEYNWRWIRN